MKRFLRLLIVTGVIAVIFCMGASTVMAESDKTAYVEASGSTLTFYYDAASSTHTGAKWDVADGSGLFTYYSEPEYFKWSKYNQEVASITEVIFDDSFSDYHGVESTSYWFGYFSKLTTITDLENLNTENVTDMQAMFHSCSSLKEIELCNFDTSHVYYMIEMFTGCSALTVLDVSSFNTATVTNMGGMFRKCTSLTTIYASTTFIVSFQGEEMFGECSSLVGGLGSSNIGMGRSYAIIDASPTECGYFTAELPSISIDKSVQSYEYTGSPCNFVVSGTSLSGFTVEYKVNGVWTQNAPSDAGSYNVKIRRKSDGIYKSVYVKINDGLVIEPKEETANPYWKVYPFISKKVTVTTVIADVQNNTENTTSTKTTISTLSSNGSQNSAVEYRAGSSVNNSVQREFPVVIYVLGGLFITLIVTLVCYVGLKK